MDRRMAVEARRRWLAAALVLATLPGGLRAQGGKHLNPLVTLLEQKQAVFGLYAPANPRGRGGRGGAPAEPAPAQKSQADLAKDALAYAPADYIFDGSMEGDFDRGYATFSEFA
ncbi:MAG: hypothetical protein FJ202_12025, partial [Gemmatimonadetes bacterium]|nr:hypothetical protein [Gemmatimonadota bacterium]